MKIFIQQTKGVRKPRGSKMRAMYDSAVLFVTIPLKGWEWNENSSELEFHNRPRILIPSSPLEKTRGGFHDDSQEELPKRQDCCWPTYEVRTHPAREELATGFAGRELQQEFPHQRQCRQYTGAVLAVRSGPTARWCRRGARIPSSRRSSDRARATSCRCNGDRARRAFPSCRRCRSRRGSRSPVPSR